MLTKQQLRELNEMQVEKADYGLGCLGFLGALVLLFFVALCLFLGEDEGPNRQAPHPSNWYRDRAVGR